MVLRARPLSFVPDGQSCFGRTALNRNRNTIGAFRCSTPTYCTARPTRCHRCASKTCDATKHRSHIFSAQRGWGEVLERPRLACCLREESCRRTLRRDRERQVVKAPGRLVGAMIRESFGHILPFISLLFVTHSSTGLTIACTAKLCDAMRSSAVFGSSVSHFSLIAPDVECFG